MPRRKDEEKLISSAPRQAVVFYPFTTRFEKVNKDNVLNTKRVDVTSSVTNLIYNKSKSNASGTFSITLKGSGPEGPRNWKHILRPGDWGMIYLSQFGIDIESTKGLKALISIDRVSRQKIISNDGKKTFLFKIEGRDFGKIFEKTQFYYNPYVPEKVQENLILLKSGIKITGTPEAFVRSYLDLYFGDGFVIKKGFKLDEIFQKLEKLDQVRIPGKIFKVFGLSETSGKLSQLLKIKIGGVLKNKDSKDDILEPEGYSWAIPPDRAVSSNLWSILNSVS